MKMYLGFYFANTRERPDCRSPSGSTTPPLVAERCSRRSRASPRAAKALGFDGLAVDQELYPSAGRPSPPRTWGWNYDGNTRTEELGSVTGESRAGQEIMETILAGFPKVEILAYGSFFPDSWDELVQEGSQRRLTPSNRDDVYIDLWDGMTTPPTGTTSIQFVNAIFYKTPHITDATWDTVYMYEFNRFFRDALATAVELVGRRRQGLRYRCSSGWRNGSTDFEVAQRPALRHRSAARPPGGAGHGAARSPTTPTTTWRRSTTAPTWLECVRIEARSRRRCPAPGPGGQSVHRDDGSEETPASPGSRWTTRRCGSCVGRPTTDATGAAKMQWDSRAIPPSGRNVADDLAGRWRAAARGRQPHRGLGRGHQGPVLRSRRSRSRPDSMRVLHVQRAKGIGGSERHSSRCSPRSGARGRGADVRAELGDGDRFVEALRRRRRRRGQRRRPRRSTRCCSAACEPRSAGSVPTSCTPTSCTPISPAWPRAVSPA